MSLGMLSQDEVQACRIAFEAFDVDNSGSIDASELRQVLKSMGQEPTDEELFQMIAECDRDCSGDIDFAEFIDMVERQAQKAELWNDEADALDAFRAFDQGRTGELTCSELCVARARAPRESVAPRNDADEAEARARALSGTRASSGSGSR